ncbi:hypothetical protein [Phaeobacter sp. C3_T13_0]|uniref:hypothetical protein n=1 Tax=Phaeobacter cretensis TaxID=3342641 RepID=UPI0039BC9763
MPKLVDIIDAIRCSPHLDVTHATFVGTLITGCAMSLFLLPYRPLGGIVALAGMIVISMASSVAAQGTSANREEICRNRAEAYAGAPRNDSPSGLRLGTDRVGITFSGTARIGISVRDGKVSSAGTRNRSEPGDRDDYFNTPDARRKRLVKQHYRHCMSQP